MATLQRHFDWLAVHALSEFCGESPKQSGLVVGYGAITDPRIDDGLRRIKPVRARKRLRIDGLR